MRYTLLGGRFWSEIGFFKLKTGLDSYLSLFGSRTMFLCFQIVVLISSSTLDMFGTSPLRLGCHLGPQPCHSPCHSNRVARLICEVDLVLSQNAWNVGYPREFPRIVLRFEMTIQVQNMVLLHNSRFGPCHPVSLRPSGTADL